MAPYPADFPAQEGTVHPLHPLAAIQLHTRHLALAGRSPRYTAARARAIRALARSLPVSLNRASPADLLAWRESLTVAPSTVRVYVSHARNYYAWAVRQGIAATDPTDGLPVPSRPRLIPRPIGEAALMAAVTCAPARVRPWLVLAGWCGLRAQEIAFLRAENVHLSACPPVLVVDTASAKGGRERVVALSPFVAAELTRAGLPRRGWAFARADGRPGPNQPWLVSHLANDHLHSCGVSETLHQLRHRFGTGLYHRTHDLRLVQELLGHAEPSSTAGYADWDRAGAADAVALLPVPRT